MKKHLPDEYYRCCRYCHREQEHTLQQVFPEFQLLEHDCKQQREHDEQRNTDCRKAQRIGSRRPEGRIGKYFAVIFQPDPLIRHGALERAHNDLDKRQQRETGHPGKAGQQEEDARQPAHPALSPRRHSARYRFIFCIIELTASSALISPFRQRLISSLMTSFGTRSVSAQTDTCSTIARSTSSSSSVGHS